MALNCRLDIFFEFHINLFAKINNLALTTKIGFLHGVFDRAFDSIRHANRFESIRFVKKSAFRFNSVVQFFLLIYSIV